MVLKRPLPLLAKKATKKAIVEKRGRRRREERAEAKRGR